MASASIFLWNKRRAHEQLCEIATFHVRGDQREETRPPRTLEPPNIKKDKHEPVFDGKARLKDTRLLALS